MYLCVCRAIREREVEAAVRAGARRPADVFRACGRNPQCGSCAAVLRGHIERTLADERALPQTSLVAAD